MNITKLASILTISLATFCSNSHAAVYTLGGPTVNPANGHSYYLLSSGSWTDAEAFSQTLGGHLATVNDAAENAWLYGTVMTSDHAWIGLKYSTGTATWNWIDGDSSSYLNWAAGEPNNILSAHAYTLLLGSSALPGYPTYWNNAPNTDNYLGIAEVVPEPSTLSLCGIMGVGLIARFRKSRAAAPCLS
jgi:hypothetical protein